MSRRAFAELLAVLAPPSCHACGEPVGADAGPLCPACRRELPWLHDAVCSRCGLPRPCRPCPSRGHAYERAWCPVAYAGPARDLVHAWKFEGALALTQTLAAAIVAQAPPGLLDRPDGVLVPVPAHPGRRRARGADVVARLGREIGRRSGLAVADDLLARRGGSADHQLGATAARRREGELIDVRAATDAPRRIVLVDDVMTTGTTLDRCARALRSAGAREVVAVAYARALR